MFSNVVGALRALRLWPQSPANRRILVDVFVIFGLAVAVRVATFDMELFERFNEYSREHEDWELDELLITIALGSLAFFAFGLRRLQDQRRELKLRVAAEKHATMLALQDPLTALPNRRRFVEALEKLVGHRVGRNAVIILDLDGVKQINDVFGHAAGDDALNAVAERLKALDEKNILTARLGGDEFAMILRNLSAQSDVDRIAEQTIAAIEAPITTEGLEQRLRASLGIAMIDDESTMADEYMRRADIALYRAKEINGSAAVTYEAILDRERQKTFELEKDLRQALSAGAIVPCYQPIVDLKTGDILKFEALARWHHPTLGDIAPTVFIPLAERRGLISEVTEAILRQACKDALSWPAPMNLSVNLSPLLLEDKSFGLRLVSLLSETHFPAKRLEVEITERALKADFGEVRSFLDNLRSLGVHISLDDFGTGYSSLTRLRQLPFDTIKIDRSFVQNLAGSPDRLQFVRAILQLGQGLGMAVAAEGVENDEQRRQLLSEGCGLGQGFLFSRAIPAEQVLDLIGTDRPAVNQQGS